MKRVEGTEMVQGLLQAPLIMSEDQLESLLYSLGANRVRRQGNNLQFDHCVIHHNNSPTLGVSLDAPFSWNCFSCGAKGPNIASLVARVRHTDEYTAAAMIMEKYNLSSGKKGFSLVRYSSEEATRPAFKLPLSALKAYPLSSNNGEGYAWAMSYLGMDRQTADHLRIGYSWRIKALIFPVFHQDKTLGGLIARRMGDDVQKGQRWCNLDAENFKKDSVLLGAEVPIDRSKPVVVVEGPKDYFNLRRLGVPNMRATLGTSVSEWQLDLLASYNVPLVILYDNDAPGISGRRNLVLRLRRRRAIVWQHSFPNIPGAPAEKQDPGMLTEDLVQDLTASFRPFSVCVRRRLTH